MTKSLELCNFYVFREDALFQENILKGYSRNKMGYLDTDTFVACVFIVSICIAMCRCYSFKNKKQKTNCCWTW